MTEEGELLTKGEALARLLWRKALGWVEKTRDDEGNESELIHKPEAWAINLVYERMEGKTPQAVTEQDESRVKAVDKVRELAVARINDLASAALEKSGPPPFKKKG